MNDLPNYHVEMLRAAGQRGPDWFLQQFVQIANSSGGSIGVTLLVGGSLVTGQIIGGAEYLKLFGEQFGGAIGMAQDDAATLYQPLIDEFYSESADDSDDGKSSPTYIHLKNVRVFQGSTQIPQNFDGILWRGRLVSVDGFILGELTQA